MAVGFLSLLQNQSTTITTAKRRSRLQVPIVLSKNGCLLVNLEHHSCWRLNRTIWGYKLMYQAQAWTRDKTLEHWLIESPKIGDYWPSNANHHRLTKAHIFNLVELVRQWRSTSIKKESKIRVRFLELPSHLHLQVIRVNQEANTTLNRMTKKVSFHRSSTS